MPEAAAEAAEAAAEAATEAAEVAAEVAAEAAEAAVDEGQKLPSLEQGKLRAAPSRHAPFSLNRWGAVVTAEPAEYAAAAAQQLAGEYQSLLVSHRIASNPRGGQQGRSSLPCTLVARVGAS